MDGAPVPREVLVIGDVMLDVVAAPCSAIEPGADTPAEITLLPGGSGANTAAWLGYLGSRVWFAGRVGSEASGMHETALRAHGVEPLLTRDESARTGVLVNLVSADGERSFLTDRGANTRLTRGDLPDRLLERIGLIHLSGYALATPGPRAAVIDFLACAAARAIPLSVDPGSATLLRDVGAAAFLGWTRGARWCFPNALEATLLAGGADLDASLETLAMHYETVAIKRGGDGAVASTGHGARRLTAVAPIVAALDTTGAGDAFVAGFLSAYLRGEDAAACLRHAVSVGSAAIAHFGGRPPLCARPPWPAVGIEK